MVPGKLLCSNCRKSILEVKPDQDNEEMVASHQSDEENEEELQAAKRIVDKDKLNEALLGLDVTPLKLKSLSTHSKEKYIKKKFKRAKTQVKKSCHLSYK